MTRFHPELIHPLSLARLARATDSATRAAAVREVLSEASGEPNRHPLNGYDRDLLAAIFEWLQTPEPTIDLIGLCHKWRVDWSIRNLISEGYALGHAGCPGEVTVVGLEGQPVFWCHACDHGIREGDTISPEDAQGTDQCDECGKPWGVHSSTTVIHYCPAAGSRVVLPATQVAGGVELCAAADAASKAPGGNR